jgi:hypothetical protein
MPDRLREAAGWIVAALAAVAAAAVLQALLNRGTGSQQRQHDMALALSAGDPDRGRAVIAASGCGACHAIPGLPGARGRVASSLRGIATRNIIGGVVANTPDNLARSLLRLIGCWALCLGVALVDGRVTYPEIPTWYASLTKPSWTNPIGRPAGLECPLFDDGRKFVAAVDRAADSARRTAITFFLTQLALNAAYRQYSLGCTTRRRRCRSLFCWPQRLRRRS